MKAPVAVLSSSRQGESMGVFSNKFMIYASMVKITRLTTHTSAQLRAQRAMNSAQVHRPSVHTSDSKCGARAGTRAEFMHAELEALHM